MKCSALLTVLAWPHTWNKWHRIYCQPCVRAWQCVYVCLRVSVCVIRCFFVCWEIWAIFGKISGLNANISVLDIGFIGTPDSVAFICVYVCALLRGCLPTNSQNIVVYNVPRMQCNPLCWNRDIMSIVIIAASKEGHRFSSDVGHVSLVSRIYTMSIMFCALKDRKRLESFAILVPKWNRTTLQKSYTS